MKKGLFLIILLSFLGLNDAICQWTTNGNNIYNSNTGNVGIGNNAPLTLLHVSKFMTEPTITVQNLGGSGGATYIMMDQVSGANWKFKATNSGGFKIRDHANLLDVIVIEANSSANALYINSTGAIGIGTAAPAASAALDVCSTEKGFLPPRLTQAQIETIPNPADGLMVYCTTDSKLYIYIGTQGQWKEVPLGASTFTPPFTCGMPITISHVAGTVAPVNKTTTYGTVTNIPGETSKCWLTSNLGSDHQASAVDDATEPSAGWYWQFNRMQGYKHDGTTRTPNTTWINSIEENSNWQNENDPCILELGNGWRMPTSTEWINIDANGNWDDWNGPWNSPLKIHAAGFLSYTDGSISFNGAQGHYWSITQGGGSTGWDFYFGSSYSLVGWWNFKPGGFSIRCIRD